MDRELLDRLGTMHRDPYPHYERARRADGLVRVPELDAWLVARDADVREVLGRPEDFSSVNALKPDVMPSPAALAVLAGGVPELPHVVVTDGDLHKRLREPIVRGLSPAKVAGIAPFVAERAAALVDEFAGKGAVELMSAYARRLPGEVVGRIVGLDPADVPAIVDGGYRFLELVFLPLPEDEQVAAAESVVRMQHILEGYVQARRADPRDDLCTDIVVDVAGEGTAELTTEQRYEAVSHLQNLLLAGHLTTSALIGTTVLHLLRHPAQWELLCAEPDRIPAAVEEAARYDTALQGFRRITTRPVTLAGTELPAGVDVFVAFGAANRDAERHPSPDAFDITREPGRHLSFGVGAHSCPGARLAREQLHSTLKELTSRLPGLRLAEDSPVVMVPMVLRSPEQLHLTW
jgi:hypothetical protein